MGSHRTRNFSLFFLLPLLVLLPGTFDSCTTFQSYRNFKDGEYDGDVATLRERGFRFWLYGGEKALNDEMILVPGEYMVGFQNTISRTGGAAYCFLDGNRTYSFRITGRQYLPETGAFALIGECFYDPEKSENLPREVAGSEPKN